MTEPIRVRTRAVAKALAAESALKVLEDETSDYHLPRLCDCKAKGSEGPAMGIGEDEKEEERDSGGGGEDLAEDPVQKDETEEGFAVLAQRLAEARERKSPRAETDRGECSDMDISEDEVEVR